jgi:hypothetical protein
MELIEIKKKEVQRAEISLKIADTIKNYTFSYSDKDIFVVDFPEELRRLLRLLPASITHSLVEKIENFITTDENDLPLEMELEKEILQLV